MARNERYVTTIELNSQQAQDHLEKLTKKVEDLKAQKAELAGKGQWVKEAELKKATKELNNWKAQLLGVSGVLDNINDVSLETLQKTLKKLKSQKLKFLPDSEEYNEAERGIAAIEDRINELKKKFRETREESQGLRDNLENLSNVMKDVSKASLNELTAAKDYLEQTLAKTTPGTPLYDTANSQLKEIKGRIQDLKAEQEKVNFAIDKYDQEIKKANKDIDTTARETELVSRTINNIHSAPVRDLEYSIKILNEELRDVERTGGNVEEITEKIKQLNTELKKVQDMQRPDIDRGNIFSRGITWLNTNWGAITQILGSITGLSVAIRSAVKEYSKMEEAMADTRKYTGLSDAAIRDLNEDLKKMDTRTAREGLNELAGAAGRLGKDSKKEILEFVDAGNMIKVALGDDLGEGAIDKVGKLAMAFGEDKTKGLRGAMLATGSAVNELAQNSSAQAGYIVDFTARVAGFGKQIGLTQAQIMGFGAVMDENMLRDEMAATAFGNMLTKMQTDTAKFAKIAGMDMKTFTDLLNKDANAAILALADSLKKADPQNMMKMLDDMGLDGSRAVGVLSTLADKIDDVRTRQELATKAYNEGISVGKEYETMNNTVEAGIEKAKKQFQEVSVALGEKLLPIVKYTISGTSMLIKVMLSITTIFREYYATIATTSIALASLIVYRERDIIATKLQIFWNEKLIAGIKRLWALIAKNPYTAAIAAIAIFIGIVSDYIRKNQEATEKTKQLTAAQREQKAMAETMKAVNEETNKSTAEEITKFKQLRKTLEDNTKKYDDRKKALEEIKRMVPEYHGALTNENTLINSNAIALDNYVTSLMSAARAQAAYNRLVRLQGSTMDHQNTLEKRQGNQAWARMRLQQLGATEGTSFRSNMGGGYQMYDEQGKYIKTITEAEKERIETLQNTIAYNNERIEQEQTILDLNKKQEEKLQKMIEENGGVKNDKGGTQSPSAYESDSERKKREADERKRLAEQRREETERKRLLKEQAEAAKASYNEQVAEEMLSYRQGLTTYSNYLEEKHNITQNYYDALKRIYGEDSTEYRKLLLNRENDEQEYITRQNKLRDRDFLVEKYNREIELQRQFNDESNHEMFQNEEALNEALFRSDMQYLRSKQSLYVNGTREWEEAEAEIQATEREHQMQLEQDWMRRLSQYREEAGRMDYDRLQQIELQGVETFYGALVAQGRMTQEEVDAIIEHIKRKYAELKGQQTVGNDVQNKAASMLETAKNNANAKSYGAGDNAATGVFSISNAIANQKTINEQLKLLYGEDYENNREYQEAKRQLDAETMQQIVAGAQAAYSTISTFMSAASSYAQACADLETAKITKEYDKQIEAAGKNSRKKERLEKERDKKIAKVKTEANKKAMAMEIAQAIAQTAMGAISAYSSTMAGAPWPANLVLAPISAGIALAAGALQIATIKKQHEAQAQGYYEGGYTGGRQYRKEAGVVHEGEFVANHNTVNNPNIRPMLDFIDRAQRNNTVGGLTSYDLQRNLGGGQPTVITPIVNVNQDNERLNRGLEEVHEAVQELRDTIDGGIGILFDMDGFDKSYRHHQKMKNR